MNDKNLNIIGAGSHARVVVEIAEMLGYYVKVYDNDFDIKNIYDYAVNHDFDEINKNENIFFAVGDNLTRKKISENYPQVSQNLIHPKAVVSGKAGLGLGNVIMAGVVINPATKIGNHCIINTLSSIDHDCLIGDFVHISPGAILAGNVEVLEGTHIGLGANIKQNIKIGKYCIIGMGAVILHNVPDFSVVVGNPAKIIRKNFLP